MKTVFQRAVSVIMCVVLIACTMSTMAFAATEFTYDKYMDRTSKSVDMNTIQLLDIADEALAKANIVIDLEDYGLGTIDATSVDKLLATIDNLRGLIGLGSNLIPDLQTLTFDAFEEGLSRKDDGDVKIIAELLELIATNSDIAKDVLAGGFSLNTRIFDIDSVIEGKFNFKFSEIPALLKGAFAEIPYNKGDANYDAAVGRARTDLDAFIYLDLIPYGVDALAGLIKVDPAVINVSVNETTTVDAFVADILNVAIIYLKSALNNLHEDLSKNPGLAGLHGELILNGPDYENLNAITGFDRTKPVIDQLNTVIGQIIDQLVPNYNTWGDNLGSNLSGAFRYLAGKLDITVEDKTDEAILVEALKKIFPATGVVGAYDNCKDLEGIAKELIRALSVKAGRLPADMNYDNKTYEQVLGDLMIALLYDDVLIATPEGKICNIGDGYTIWEVWNYILNFFFVDKNFDLLIGKDGMTKNSTMFQKVDSILDMLAADGTADFDSKARIGGMLDAVLNLNFGKIFELTIVEALDSDKAGQTATGSVKLSEFVYNTVYALLYNWAGKKDLIRAYTSNKPFNTAFSGDNLGNMAATFLATVSGCTFEFEKNIFGNKTDEKIIHYGDSRANAICSLIGLLVNGSETVSVDVSSVADAVYTGKAIDPAAVVYATYRGKKVRLEQNVDYKVILAKNDIGSTTATIEGIGAYKGSINKNVNIKFGTLSGLAAKPASTSSVALSWKALAGAKSYNIYNGSTLVKSGVTGTSYTVTGLSAGKQYTFKVEAVNGSTKSAQASVATVTLPAQVTGLKATSSSSTSVKLTWTAVSGAAGYYVQQYASGKWTTVKTVTTNSVTLSAKANTTYKYRVLAFSKNSAGTAYNGAVSAEASVRTNPSKPSSLSKKTVTASTVALSWKKVSGATGYEIYNSKGKKVGSTKSTSYTVKKLSGNTTYKYKVRAYVTSGKKTYYSDFTSYVSAKTLIAAPKSFKVKEATATSMTLSWKKVSGAKKYQVYYSTNNGKKWKKATTSKTSYKIMDLKANTAIQVKVRVYNSSKTTGEFTSVIKTSTAPSKVTVSKLSAGKKKFTVSWKKVSGASGYEVQYATNSKFKKAKTVTIKKGKTVKSEIKKLKKGTKYYVRVRAYKTVGKEKIYGKYSEYEVVKVK